MYAKKPETNQMTILRCGSILAIAGVLMTGTLVASGSSWPGDGQDDSKSRARIISRNQKFARIADEKSSSATVLSSSANDALDWTLAAASGIDIAKYSSEKGEMGKLVRKVIQACDVASKAQANADSAAAEAARYAAQAANLAARYEAGEDIKPSEIRRAKRKAVKAEQRAKAQMKLAELKADMATRLAEKYEAMPQNDSGNDDTSNSLGYSYDEDGDGNHDFTDLPIDDQGWTVFTPSEDTRIFYVSSSTGHDWDTSVYYDATSPEIRDDPFDPMGSVKAYKTLAAAYKQLRDGHPDWLLLKRGDVWVNEDFNPPGSWVKSGPSDFTQPPLLVSAYGPRTFDRPKILTPDGVTGIQAIANHAGGVDNVAFAGLHLEPYDLGSDATGLRWLVETRKFLMEDCYIAGYGSKNIVFQAPKDPEYQSDGIVIRRCVSYRSGSQGLYTESMNNLLIEECLFDHNGWIEEIPGMEPSIYNHNVYVQAGDEDEIVTVRGCTFARGSSHGLQLRTGGEAYENLFVQNALGMMLGAANSGNHPHPGGVHGQVKNNVFINPRDIDLLNKRGIGLEIGNVNEATIDGNLFLHDQLEPLNSRGISFLDTEFGGVGISDVTITKNVVFNWGTAIDVGGEGDDVIRRVRISNNQFQLPDQTRKLIRYRHSLSNGSISYDLNRYYSLLPEDQWFDGALPEDRNKTLESFDRPNVTLDDYSESIGGAPTLEAYLKEAREQRHGYWRSAYTSSAADRFFRAAMKNGHDQN